MNELDKYLEVVKENKDVNNKFIIFYGLSGGFGGAQNYEAIIAKNEEEAYKFAYEAAIQEYESYAGMHGLTSLDEIYEENEGIDEEEANEIYMQEMESWLDYGVLEYNEKNIEKARMHHFQDFE